MLVKDIKVVYKRTYGGEYIWTFIDYYNEERILFMADFGDKKLNRTRGKIVSNKIYNKKIVKGKRIKKNYVEFDIVSRIDQDIRYFIHAVGVVLVDSQLKLVVQYRPKPNIWEIKSYNLHPKLSALLGMGHILAS